MGCIKIDVKKSLGRSNGIYKGIGKMEKIEKKATELDLIIPQEFEIIGFNEMLAYVAYVGMPSKYPH